MQGETVLLCADADLRRMLEALCTLSGGPEIVVADGEDPAVRRDASACARERGLPLLLIGGAPEETGEIPSRTLPRPFRFSDFRDALGGLCADAAVPQNADDADEPRLLQWDAKRRTVICGDVRQTLTPREADVFAQLYAAAPSPVSRERLMAGFARTGGNGAEVYISYLRRKLAALPQTVTIAFVRGQGYALLIQQSTRE